MTLCLCLFPSGLDYVSHEDILPYNSAEQVPIQHELFERFLIYNPTKCKPSSTVSTSISNTCLHSKPLQHMRHKIITQCFIHHHCENVEQRENSIFSKYLHFVLLFSSAVYSQRHAEGVAGEEPPMAGALRRAQGDHWEHPSHRHPLLHGNEGKWIITRKSIYE